MRWPSLSRAGVITNMRVLTIGMTSRTSGRSAICWRAASSRFFGAPGLGVVLVDLAGVGLGRRHLDAGQRSAAAELVEHPGLGGGRDREQRGEQRGGQRDRQHGEHGPARPAPHGLDRQGDGVAPAHARRRARRPPRPAASRPVAAAAARRAMRRVVGHHHQGAPVVGRQRLEQRRRPGWCCRRRGCRWARRPAPGGAGWPAPGRWPPAGARRRSARPGGGGPGRRGPTASSSSAARAPAGGAGRRRPASRPARRSRPRSAPRAGRSAGRRTRPSRGGTWPARCGDRPDRSAPSTTTDPLWGASSPPSTDSSVDLPDARTRPTSATWPPASTWRSRPSSTVTVPARDENRCDSWRTSIEAPDTDVMLAGPERVPGVGPADPDRRLTCGHVRRGPRGDGADPRRGNGTASHAALEPRPAG